jgi:hypothetical protein
MDLNMKRNTTQFDAIVSDIRSQFNIKILERSSKKDLVTNGEFPSRS